MPRRPVGRQRPAVLRAIIGSAPPGPSSPGWNMKHDVAGERRRAARAGCGRRRRARPRAGRDRTRASGPSRSEAKSTCLGDRERVHVTAQQHHRALPRLGRAAATAQHCDDAAQALAQGDLEVEPGQRVEHGPPGCRAGRCPSSGMRCSRRRRSTSSGPIRRARLWASGTWPLGTEVRVTPSEAPGIRRTRARRAASASSSSRSCGEGLLVGGRVVHPPAQQRQLARGVLEGPHRRQRLAAGVGPGPGRASRRLRHRREHRHLGGREPARVGVGRAGTGR